MKKTQFSDNERAYCELHNLCDYVEGKTAVSNLNETNYISTENMLQNKGGITKAASLPSVYKTQTYQSGDVLVSNIRPYFKKIWLATYDGGCSNDVLVLRPKKGVDNSYLYYLLANDQFFDYATSTVKGTKMPRGDRSAIMKYRCWLPDIDTQQKIGAFLIAFDKRIAVNQKINRNLLQQISLIYNQIIEQEQETFTTLGNLCKFQEGYVNPSQGESRYFGGDVKWLRAVDINGEYIFNTSKSLTQEGYKSAGKSALMFEPDTLAISKSGTIGRVGILADYMCGNRAVINITPLKQNHLPLIYAYLSSRQEELKNLAVGSVQRNLYISILSPLKIGLPNKEKVFHFCETAQRFLKMVKTVSEENQHLADLRDALLPKLMSGELDVSELDI